MRSIPGALKLTISKFYRPSGASTELRGVASDIVIPAASGVLPVGESKLTDPLPWDTIPAAALQAVRPGGAVPGGAARRLGARMAADPAFAELRPEIARLKSRLDDNSVSLNEAERRRELAEDKAIEKAIAAKAEAEEADIPAYEITVKAAGLPGLPRGSRARQTGGGRRGPQTRRRRRPRRVRRRARRRRPGARRVAAHPGRLRRPAHPAGERGRDGRAPGFHRVSSRRRARLTVSTISASSTLRLPASFRAGERLDWLLCGNGSRAIAVGDHPQGEIDERQDSADDEDHVSGQPQPLERADIAAGRKTRGGARASSHARARREIAGRRWGRDSRRPSRPDHR